MWRRKSVVFLAAVLLSSSTVLVESFVVIPTTPVNNNNNNVVVVTTNNKRGRGVKGQPRKATPPPTTTTTLLNAEAGDGDVPSKKKRKAVKKKGVKKKKKTVKKKSVQKKGSVKKKKGGSVKKKTKATKMAVEELPSTAALETEEQTAATTTSSSSRSSTPTPAPTPPVVVTTRIRDPTTIPLHEIGMPKTSHKPRQGIDASSLGDLTGGRPGAIIESEEQLDRKQEMFDELAQGSRDHYDPNVMKDYGTLEEELDAEYDIDDPDVVDATTLGTWTIKDLQSKFPYEWDPENPDDVDPNTLELQQPGVQYKPGVDVDGDGIEIGYNPAFGPSTTMDERTILGAAESYMINDRTKNEKMIPPQFVPGDLEIQYNQDVVKFRKSMDIIETYTDEFLPPEMQVPRHVAKWHGYPEAMSFPHKNFTNNRFLEDTPEPTNWDKLTPYEARRKAVELARAQNAEWLPVGKSQAYHASKREPYDRVGTLVGSLTPAETIDETLVKAIQPALDILGSVVDLLSIEGPEQTVFRFYYYGLMKNRHGMAAWTETLIRDCGVDVTGVIFETGFRRRDMAYEGGDCWYPPSS